MVRSSILVILVSFVFVALGPAARAVTYVVDANGGDCGTPPFVATWDQASKTCTLQDDLTGAIFIDADGITLNGNGKTLRPGQGDTFGIAADRKSTVTVSAFVVDGFGKGIVFQNGRKVSVQKNTVKNGRGGQNPCGICFVGMTLSKIIDNGNIDGNGAPGILLWASDTNEIARNGLHANKSSNIELNDSSGNVISDNRVMGDSTDPEFGIYILRGGSNWISFNTIKKSRAYHVSLADTNNNRLLFNTMSDAFAGVKIDRSGSNLVYCNNLTSSGSGIDLTPNSALNSVWWNNFLAGTSARDRAPGPVNIFDFPRPIGGNYWERHQPACQDIAPQDGFCDAPFMFRGNADDLPHTGPINWKLDPSICLRFGPSGETEVPVILRGGVKP